MPSVPRTPNYQLKEPWAWSTSGNHHDTRTLPQGAFVRPIEATYVPKHILEAHEGYNPSKEVFVYCRYGIILIPKNILREA